jgi:hypothetical protein
MAMLAEPRRKQKFSFDPRNTNWSNGKTLTFLQLYNKIDIFIIFSRCPSRSKNLKVISWRLPKKTRGELTNYRNVNTYRSTFRICQHSKINVLKSWPKTVRCVYWSLPHLSLDDDHELRTEEFLEKVGEFMDVYKNVVLWTSKMLCFITCYMKMI